MQSCGFISVTVLCKGQQMNKAFCPMQVGVESNKDHSVIYFYT
uniref:Uncharacterized protein n=1 Tax=Arundo donax TaxID=35708 RepID=A0A0A8YNL2_ARUDO